MKYCNTEICIMSLLGLLFTILLTFTGKANAGFGDESFNPADVYIIPERTYMCENTEPDIDFYADLRNINDNGDKVVDIEFNLEDTQITDQWKIYMVVDKWNNGDWDPKFFEEKGLICKQLSKYASGALENFKKQLKPTVTETCLIKTGQYKLTDFTVKPSDISIPVAVVGKYRFTGRLYDETDEEMLCQVFELEVKKH